MPSTRRKVGLAFFEQLEVVVECHFEILNTMKWSGGVTKVILEVRIRLTGMLETKECTVV